MAPKGSRPALLLPLALLVACLALASGHYPNPKCKRFFWEHWDYPKSPPKNPDDYCNKMMWHKGLFGKPKHTFIHEPLWMIKDVCPWGGKCGWFESKHPFHLTQCIFIPHKKCYFGQPQFRRIVLYCWYGCPIDILECMKGSHWGWKGHEEKLESWSVPSSQYMSSDSSSASASASASASEPWAEDSDVPIPPPSAASSAHCEE